MSRWTLFSNHGHVLVCLALDPESRLRDVAGRVGITERAVQKIVRDLQNEGIIDVSKHGRRNRYRVNSQKNLRHSLEGHCTIGQLVTMVKQAVVKQAPVVKSTKQPITPEPQQETKSQRQSPAGKHQGSLF